MVDSRCKTDSQPLTLAISPCPNDTYIFHALATGRLGLDGAALDIVFEDVETLNQAAQQGRFDITKLSFHAFLHARKHYRLLRAGAALGYGAGPLLVAREQFDKAQLKDLKVLVPGVLTTAHLLLRLYQPDVLNKMFVRYDRILPMLQQGEADAGVIIHEDRFVFEEKGFVKIADLGAFWEARTGTPIPLGCIAMRRALAPRFAEPFDALVRESIALARADIDAALPFIRRHAQQMTRSVLEQHIATFVNDLSVDLGAVGDQAVAALEQLAAAAGIVS